MLRNNAVDFLKFIFALIIVLFHANSMTIVDTEKIFINGRIGVEFFFIVSGYFMCVSAENKLKNNDVGEDTFLFIRHKISKLMPNFYIAYLIAFLVFHINSGTNSVYYFVISGIQSIPELLLIKNSGIRAVSYNGVTWYLSAMILSMVIIYPLIRRLKNTFYYIIAPISFLFIMGNLFQNYGSLSNLENWNGFMLKGTIRGFADILGGCICYKISLWISKYNFTKLGKIMLTMIEWGCYFIVICLIYSNKPSGYDFFIFLLLMIGTIITFSNVSFDSYIFQNSIFGWLGKFSFSLYLGHSYWRLYNSNIFPENYTFYDKLAMYLVLSVITSLFIMYVSIFLKDVWNRKKYIIKHLLVER